MLFMNHWEIDEALNRWKLDPILGPATQTLANLRDAADANSDGWCYWPKPTRAAAKLMEYIQEAERDWRNGRTVACSVPSLKAAYRPIKAFRTRSGIEFAIIEPTC